MKKIREEDAIGDSFMLGDGLDESSALTAAATGRQRARRLERMEWDFITVLL